MLMKNRSSALSGRAVIQLADYLKRFTLVQPENEEVFCIAYGSNLNVERMRQRCPGAEVFGTSTILGYRMLFKQSMTGAYATIEQDANSCVPVVVYRMTAAAEARLDRFEGYPKYYYKREFFLPVWNLSGRKLKKRRSCIVYIMHEHRHLGEPSMDYFRLLDDGYDHWCFDKAPLEAALDNSIGYKQAAAWIRAYEKERRRT